ncbi:MAG TPA: class Ib ribonucleoside-diphosphate reductase assembly flavoprotein NrdI [Acholeplasma sp.]|jgi:protein involved in ribonucleotide reduction
MLIIYDSLTGQTKRFANQLGYQAMHIKLYEGEPKDHIFLVTRSINFGKVPETTTKFLETYKDQVIACAVSGNKNWGSNYGKAGEIIEQTYKIPLILKFEASGFKDDIEKVKMWIQHYLQEKGL